MAQQPIYRRGRSTRLLVVGLVTLCLMTITVDYRGGETGPLAVAGRTMLSVISPLQRAMSNALEPVGDFFSTITNFGSLRAENEALRLEIGRLLQARGTELTLRRENERLRMLLGLKQQLQGTSVEGRVIAMGVSNFEWEVTINLGSEDGVQLNDAVMAPEGLLGHVVRVTRDSANVELIFDPDSSVGARLPASGGAVGSLEGRGDADLRFELVDPTIEVALGDPVVTAGLAIGGTDKKSLYPPNVGIGTVSGFLEDDAAVEKAIEVRPYVDVTSLDLVLVLID